MEMRNEEIMREEIKKIIKSHYQENYVLTSLTLTKEEFNEMMDEIIEVIKEEEKPNCPTMEEAEASGNHECQECLEYNYKKC